MVENKWCRNLIINFPKPFCYPNTQFGEISGLVACSETTTDIPLATLVAQHAEYDGQTLSTTGIVRTFDEPLHYWIEDDDLNRVAIEPDEAVSGYVGKRVRVTGDYRADRETGRVLEAAEVTVLGTGAG